MAREIGHVASMRQPAGARTRPGPGFCGARGRGEIRRPRPLSGARPGSRRQTTPCLARKARPILAESPPFLSSAQASARRACKSIFSAITSFPFVLRFGSGVLTRPVGACSTGSASADRVWPGGRSPARASGRCPPPSPDAIPPRRSRLYLCGVGPGAPVGAEGSGLRPGPGDGDRLRGRRGGTVPTWPGWRQVPARSGPIRLAERSHGAPLASHGFRAGPVGSQAFGHRGRGDDGRCGRPLTGQRCGALPAFRRRRVSWRCGRRAHRTGSRSAEPVTNRGVAEPPSERPS